MTFSTAQTGVLLVCNDCGSLIPLTMKRIHKHHKTVRPYPSITVKRLKQILNMLPDDATIELDSLGYDVESVSLKATTDNASVTIIGD